MPSFLHFSDEVKKAQKENKMIVALESTIISHGMPYPENIKTAKTVENIIRKQGATPATIAIYDGKIHIGLNSEQMLNFAKSNHIHKASRRDMAFYLSQKLQACTTVAATMHCAFLANIRFFITGGIGGVHHQVQTSFDISADLTELANTPVNVISAGAKSILDLPKTLEVLETQSVPVIGYQTDEFPAFYSHSSGIAVPHRLDTVEDIAQLIITQEQLQLANGILITTPIPKSAEIPHEDIAPVIQQALQETKDIKGKAITPFLLSRVNQLTEGESLKANIELIKNNALIGSQIAMAYHQKCIK